ATSQANPNVSAENSTIAHALVVRGVSVSISPGYRSEPPGTALAYTVTITNRGNVPDSYVLSVSDNAVPSWGPTLDNVRFENVPPGASRTTTLRVTIPSWAENCARDNIVVTVTGTGVMAENSAIAHALVIRAVSVSISPSYQSGAPGETLHYTVTVKNTGNVPDSYDLSISGGENWTPTLDTYRFENVQPGETKVTMLRVTTPQDGASAVIMVRVRGTTGVEDSATCAAYIRTVGRGMRVDIFPSFRSGAPGDSLYYAVVVTNTGSADDVYDLSARDTMGWSLLLYDGSLKVPAGESRGTILRVTIRDGAPFGAVDNITVVATSRADPLVTAENRCSARAAKLVLYPEADAQVAEGYPDRNYGGTTYLYVQNDLGSAFKNERAYLRFDLSAIPPGTSIASARYFNFCWRVLGTVGQNVEVRAVENDNWGEMTITWDNQPSYGEVLDVTAIYAANTWYSWDITSFVASEFAGDKKASIVMKAERESVTGPGAFTYAFEAREYSIRPYLEIMDARPPLVSVSISPTLAEGLPGGRLSFTVSITNRRATADTYSLRAVDNSGWGPTLSVSSISLEPGTMGRVTLTAVVPEGTPLGAGNRIIVVATSTTDPTVSEEYYCTARASMRVRPPVEDSFVHRGRENINFGSDTTVYVGRYLGTPERAFLKFDLSAIPRGATIGSAELKLWCWRVDGEGARVQVHAVDDDSWREGTITWRNQPSIGAALAGPVSVRENNRWYSWDVTSFVASEFAGDKLVSFALIDVDENAGADNRAARFNSKEYWNTEMHPYLEITLGLPGVSASVSPYFLKGTPGATISYTVTIRNTGGVDDNYVLSVADTLSWTLSISPERLENVRAGSVRTATLTVAIPENAAAFSEDKITITVTSLGYPSINASASCIARANPLRSVAVVLSDNQVGVPGSQLNYVVTVVNRGLLPDNYDLSIVETLPWGASVSPTRLEVPATPENDPSYGSRTATLRVTIPTDAENGATSYMTVTATSRENRGVSASATCYARAVIRGVSLNISPSSQAGLPGATLGFTVVVVNTGKVDDTYSLTVGDSLGWELSLSRASVSLAPGASASVALSVRLPRGARGGSSDNISVIARGTGVSAQANCTAQVAVVRGVSVSISPKYRSGVPGTTLSYIIAITNTGNVEDDYILEATDTTGWDLLLSENLFVGVSPGGTRQTTLTVTIPTSAVGCTKDNIWVNAISLSDTTAKATDCCIAHAEI
ncbi:MAG: DNRLRE domain-containing protein, partial [Hadesarchaea archaeon]|nr:DNRLRE domain-containing protein [Hadesarchaea archaeon]